MQGNKREFGNQEYLYIVFSASLTNLEEYRSYGAKDKETARARFHWLPDLYPSPCRVKKYFFYH